MSSRQAENLVVRICCAAVLALGLAACGSKTVAPVTPAPVTVTEADPAASMAAQQAALAAGAAKMASDDAAAAVAAVDASQAADMPSYIDAQDAAAAALAASMAAQAASDAAGTATTTAAAQEQRDIALAKQTEAETALADARNFADAVQMAAQQAIDDAAIEVTNLSNAKAAAMTAAMAARMAADDAQAAADTVADLTGDGSSQAMAAQAAADAAATAAEEASARAQAATMSADAVVEQTTAETAQGTADDQLAMAQDLMGESQVASDAAAQLLQARDIADAQEAAKAAAEAALAHYNLAVQSATDARAKAVAARGEADRAGDARTDSGEADTQATAAEMAATEAETARDMAWTAVAAANDASMSAMGATTSADAEMYQEAAEAAEATADAQATDAGMNYMTAMEAAAAAETAARTHFLGLFTSANAYDVKDDDDADAEVASVGTAIAAAAAMADGNQAGRATATAAWLEDTPDNRATADVDEAMAGLLKITFNSMVTDGTEAFTSDTVGDADADPAEKPNAKQTDVGGDFPHLFDISSGQARVLVFTDREQDTAAVEGVTAVTFLNAAVVAADIESLGESSDGGTSFPGTFDAAGDDITAIEGTFKCTGENCSLVYTGSGDDVMVTTATGYTFSGSREAVEEVAEDSKDDYLLFGVWLDENAAGADTFGAFAGGEEPFDAENVLAVLKGTATYRGPAVGAHHKTGSGVSFFDGDANLTADFGTDTSDGGSIGGTIDNISVDGADPMEESIHLVKTTFANTDNTFNGFAVLGQQEGPGQASHTFNGTWSGGFFGNGKKATDHPGSVAGTFGVTDITGTGADAVTESYVGAFGAHQQ